MVERARHFGSGKYSLWDEVTEDEMVEASLGTSGCGDTTVPGRGDGGHHHGCGGGGRGGGDDGRHDRGGGGGGDGSHRHDRGGGGGYGGRRGDGPRHRHLKMAKQTDCGRPTETTVRCKCQIEQQ